MLTVVRVAHKQVIDVLMLVTHGHVAHTCL